MKTFYLSKFIKIFNLFKLLCFFSFLLFGCNSEKQTCPNCPGEDDDNQQSAMVANISGVYNFRFVSESFEYHSYDFNEYIMREIVAKMFVDSLYLEIRLTFNDFYQSNQTFDLSEENANARITIYSLPAEYFQHNITGNINLSTCNDNEINATFTFNASTTNENRTLSVNQGVINYKR